MKIVFMGTPEFAVASLKALYEAGHNIVGVYTRMDTPKNRGMKLLPPPVKIYAQEKGLPVFQPKGLRKAEVQQQLAALEPELIVVAAYGRILPQAVLELPKYGCLNVHASLLPAYRGASPINACILHGEKEAGVTIMQMDAGIDTGDMLLKASTELLPEENYGSLHDRLAQLGGKAIVEAVSRLENGETLPAEKQPAEGSYAPMIETEDCRISFQEYAFAVSCKIRAYDPQPGAFCQLGGGKIKLFGGALVQENGIFGEPGTILKVDRTGVQIACKQGIVCASQVQAAGGKKMPADAYFRGHQALLQEHFC